MKTSVFLGLLTLFAISSPALANSYRCTYYWWASGIGGYHEYIYTEAATREDANLWFKEYLESLSSSGAYIANYGCIEGSPN